MRASKILVVSMVVVLTASSYAAVSADEAKELGKSLTPWGAEKAGNKDGSIPAYSAEPIKIPNSFDPKNPGIRPDPYGDEKPLFSITAQNYSQYACAASRCQGRLAISDL